MGRLKMQLQGPDHKVLVGKALTAPGGQVLTAGRR